MADNVNDLVLFNRHISVRVWSRLRAVEEFPAHVGRGVWNYSVRNFSNACARSLTGLFRLTAIRFYGHYTMGRCKESLRSARLQRQQNSSFTSECHGSAGNLGNQSKVISARMFARRASLHLRKLRTNSGLDLPSQMPDATYDHCVDDIMIHLRLVFVQVFHRLVFTWGARVVSVFHRQLLPTHSAFFQCGT